jgi:D-beta-D-heptose 7-phosphate kinase/D-beta-D-heptose 1-phosphate adenosyltransferase|tara:strand:- start:2919 stop:3752 length:834 start_codon:yes stop_codon:yes gene_type:complete
VANVIVIGDKCTDKYVFGKTTRLSPEQPVPVLDQTRIEERPGMAANTELNLKAFGVNTVLLSQREQITKTRFIDTTSGYQFLRLDETPKVGRIANAELKMAMLHMDPDAIVISDYDKGYLNEDDLWNLCHNFNRPVFVDTKKRRLFHKDNVFWKINKKEYNDLDKDHLPNDTHLIVTLGNDGALWAGLKFLPQVVKVFDVCGAGDTFMAALVYEFLRTKDIRKSIDLANRAAAISVTHPGAYYLTGNDIISLYGEGNGKNVDRQGGSNAPQTASVVA